MTSPLPKIVEKQEIETNRASKKPPMYQVLLHNDHYTTMEFVVDILVQIFHKTISEATQIMLAVHHKGIGVCGIYTYEIAETKVKKVQKKAEQNGFPLLCTFEKVDE